MRCGSDVSQYCKKLSTSSCRPAEGRLCFNLFSLGLRWHGRNGEGVVKVVKVKMVKMNFGFGHFLTIIINIYIYYYSVRICVSENDFDQMTK